MFKNKEINNAFKLDNQWSERLVYDKVRFIKIKNLIEDWTRNQIGVDEWLRYDSGMTDEWLKDNGCMTNR